MQISFANFQPLSSRKQIQWKKTYIKSTFKNACGVRKVCDLCKYLLQLRVDVKIAVARFFRVARYQFKCTGNGINQFQLILCRAMRGTNIHQINHWWCPRAKYKLFGFICWRQLWKFWLNCQLLGIFEMIWFWVFFILVLLLYLNI